MQKTYLFSMQSGMLQTNAPKSIECMDTVLFLTIGKPDIYRHKNLGKSSTVFYLGDQKLPRLAADLLYLIFSAIYISLPISGDCTFTALPVVGKSTVSVYPTNFRCICKQPSYLHREKVRFFTLTALDLLN